MRMYFKAGFAGVVAITLTATTMASGPKWSELLNGGGDAGDLPFGAQVTMGPGSLAMINGNLGMLLPGPGGVDTVDMFLINIVSTMDFRVTTDPEDPELDDASAQFDTQLWLFRPTGVGFDALGVMGNDDHFELGGQFSLLLPDTTDGFGDGLNGMTGLYLLAITRFNHDPFSGAGNDIFDQMDPTEISGPDGPGGMAPITGWAGDQGGDFAGEYHIALRGVEMAKVPAPGALGLFMIAAVGTRRRRRRPLLG